MLKFPRAVEVKRPGPTDRSLPDDAKDVISGNSTRLAFHIMDFCINNAVLGSYLVQ